MPRQPKTHRLSKLVFWNCLLVFFELIVLGAIEAYFLRHSIETFSKTTLNQHLNSQEKTLNNSIVSLSNLLASDVAEGLIGTGHFDKIKIIDDFGKVLVDVEHDIAPTFFSNLAQNIFRVKITRDIERNIVTRFGTKGHIIVRANLTSLVESQMQEIFLRTLCLTILSLFISLTGTTFLVFKVKQGANALAQLASEISANKHEEPPAARHYHFEEFEFLARHLQNSVHKLMEANTQLNDATRKRQDIEESYHLTLQSLKLFTRFFNSSGEVLYSNIEGLEIPAFERAFHNYHKNLLSYLNLLEGSGYECKVLAHTKAASAIIGEQLKIQVADQEDSWLVQISMLDGGRVLLTCSDISEVRLSDSRRFHREKIEALGRISSNVAHEFNNMLNIILNALETSKTEKAQTADLINTALLAGNRAKGVVTRLQQLSRNQAIACQNVDLAAWLESSQTLMKAIAGPGTEIVISCAQTTSVIADPSALDAIIVNLCKNSADAMKGSGRISVLVYNHEIDTSITPKLDPLKRYVRICYRDTGPGIPKKIQQKIFEPYFTTKEHDKGTGLGLSEAKTMIEEMRGDIYVVDNKAGAEFNLIFPKSEIVLHQPKRRNLTAPALKPPVPAQFNRSVLIVEDEVLLSKLWAGYLSPLGMDVVTFPTIAQARAYLDSCAHEIDVAILDNTLPDGFGAELLADLRDKQPNCRCISISGEQEIQTPDRFDAHATKPITLARLQDLILSDLAVPETA